MLFSYESYEKIENIPLSFRSFIYGIKRCWQLLADLWLHFAPCLPKLFILLGCLSWWRLRWLLGLKIVTLLLNCWNVSGWDLMGIFQTEFSWVTAIISLRATVWTIIINAKGNSTAQSLHLSLLNLGLWIQRKFWIWDNDSIIPLIGTRTTCIQARAIIFR